MSEKTIPLKKKILVSQLERLLKEHNISCNAVKLIDTFNLSCIFELQTAIDVKQIAKIPVAIAYALNVDIDLIDIKLSGRYLYLTLPQPTAMIFSFSQICNKDLELRQDKAFNDYLLLPTGIKENGDIAYLDLSKNVHWSIIGASQQGKSNALLNIILNLLIHSKNTIQLYLIDFLKKKFDSFTRLQNISVGNTINQAIHQLEQVSKIIDSRYENKKQEYYPIFVLIDELQQILSTCPNLAESIEKISSTGLEAKVKLIVGTQKLSINTIEGLKNTKNNLLASIQFKVKDKSEGSQLYNKDTSSLNVGQAIIDNTQTKELVQFSYVSKKELEDIISRLTIDNNKELEVEKRKEPTQENPIQPKLDLSIISLEIWQALAKMGNEISSTKLRQQLGKSMDYTREQIENLITLSILEKQNGINKPCLITQRGLELITQFKSTGRPPVDTVDQPVDISRHISRPNLTIVYSNDE